MGNFFKRFVNLLSIIGTGIGLLLLALPNYNYKTECLIGMVIGYTFIAGLNYLLFSKPVIWNKRV